VVKEGSRFHGVEAVVGFLQSGGSRAIITSIEKLREALDGKPGTHFTLE
jgi:carbamate kinase